MDDRLESKNHQKKDYEKKEKRPRIDMNNQMK